MTQATAKQNGQAQSERDARDYDSLASLDDAEKRKVEWLYFNEELKRSRVTVERKRRETAGLLLLGIALTLATPVIWHLASRNRFEGVTVFLGLVVLVMASVWRGDAAREAERLRDFEFRRDLAEGVADQHEIRAERLLGISESQLRRYYAMNLGQGHWVFFVGVFALVCGLVIAGGTMWLIWNRQALQQPSGNLLGEKIVIAVVGVVTTVLVNYVAAIFLKMHAAIVAQVAGFHAKLVGTHQLFFANLLTSRVAPPELQSKVLGEIAIALARSTNVQPLPLGATGLAESLIGDTTASGNGKRTSEPLGTDESQVRKTVDT